MSDTARALAQIEQVLARMDPDDAALVLEMFGLDIDGQMLVDLLRTYYRDLDRADRTPRAIIYVHLGLLLGLLDRSPH